MVDLDRYYRMDILTYGNDMWKEGYEKGFKKGFERGVNKLADLFSKLLSAGRVSDAKKAASDEEYRSKLFEEFQID